MITSQDKHLISRLIKKYAENSPTESMIAFVADTNGMLAVIRTLVNSNNNDDQFTISWVDEQCHDRKVDVRGFLYEVEQILSIFQPGHKIDEHYAALELEDGASDDEIKQAYRQLSRRYHPDTASSDDLANGDMFVKITKAYHALIDDEKGHAKIAISSPSVNHWREQKKHHVSRERKKKNLFWFAALASVMIVASLIVGSKYKQRAMIAGLQSSRAAFIPPEASIIPPSEIVAEEVVVPSGQLEEIDTKESESIDEPVEVAVETIEHIKPEVVQQAEEPISQTVTEPIAPSIQSPPTNPIEKTVATVKKQPPTEKKIKREKDVAQSEDIPEEKISPVQSIAQQTVAKQQVESLVNQVIEVPPPVGIQAGTQKKIEIFLSEYIQAYENKDMLAFTNFFDLQSTENGKSLAEILPTYSELFQNSKMVSLDVSSLKWEETGDMIQLDGRFTINIKYKNDNKVHGTGAISFQLLNNKDQLSIKDMTYQFDN